MSVRTKRARRAPSSPASLRFDVLVIALLSAVVSIVVAVLVRRGIDPPDFALSPARVLDGSGLSLVSWILLERSPLALLVELAILLRIGPDLARAETRASFLFTYVALGVVVALIVVGIGWFDDAVRVAHYDGLAAQVRACVVAWGSMRRPRPLRIARRSFAVHPIAMLAVAVTLAWTAYYGVAHEFPSLVAVSLALVYARTAKNARKRRRTVATTALVPAKVRVIRKGDQWIVEVEDEHVSR